MPRKWWAAVAVLISIATAAEAGPLVCRTPLALRISHGGQTVAAVYRGFARAAGQRGAFLEPGTCSPTDAPAPNGMHEIVIKTQLLFRPLQDASFDAYRVQPTLNGTYGLAGQAAAYGRLLAGTELILKILVERDLVVTGLGTEDLFVEPYYPPPTPIATERIGSKTPPIWEKVTPKTGN